MCKQPSASCLNHSCKGFAQILALISCEDRPHCEIKSSRIPRNLRSTDHYCPNCRGLTKKERKYMMNKIWHRNHKKAGNLKGQEGGANDAVEGAHATVEQHAESSAIGASRGALGGAFLPGLGDHLSAPKETETPLPTLTEIGPLDARKDATGIFNGPSTPDNHTTGPDAILIDPTLLHIDAILSNTGDLSGNLQEAEQFLRDMGVWIEPPDSKDSSVRKEK